MNLFIEITVEPKATTPSTSESVPDNSGSYSAPSSGSDNSGSYTAPSGGSDNSGSYTAPSGGSGGTQFDFLSDDQ